MSLAVECEVVHAILLPTSFVVFSTKRFLFAVAHGSDAIGCDSFLHQSTLQGFGAAAAEGYVVFLRASIVAVAFDHNFDGGMLRDRRSVILNGRRLV